jgi:hypothetical protein
MYCLVVYLPICKYIYILYIYEFVSWDDDIPNIYIYMEKEHVPNHQADKQT